MSPANKSTKASHRHDGDGAHDAHKTSFEASIQRLGKIVEQLEEGELPLEDSLALFEEGIKLTRQSQARLDAAERRIEELLAVSEEGEPMTRPMTLRDDE